ncbi:Sensor histidine kinase RcsC [Sinobacterium norvegicum]|uniref:histidine kinase n=1 Tax=Sinobacterium norvegicum TaxID=1641715 RepID=A0ABN8EJ10_9GAMM|nr:hybrid sensor histidine kinase/response regulator [Sinobacterium norvegicum]CAH0992384.1 Sensor histidine kinase RcsC [Sinobacterium norvegicum]
MIDFLAVAIKKYSLRLLLLALMLLPLTVFSESAAASTPLTSQNDNALSGGALTVDVDGKPLSMMLQPHLEYLADDSEQLTLQVLEDGKTPHQFAPLPTTFVLKNNTVYWLRFKLKNSSGYSQQLVLDFNEVLFWELDVYSVGFNNSQNHYSVGLSRSELAPIRGRFYAFPLELTAETEQVIYIRARTPYFVEVKPYLFDPISYSGESFLKRNISNVILGMLMGILLFLTVFVGYVRDSSDAIYYLAFVSLSALIVASSGGYLTSLWPDNVWMNTHMYSITVGGMLVTFIGFSRSYFESKETMPWVDKYLAVLLFAGAVHLVSIPFIKVAVSVDYLMILVGLTMLSLLVIGPYVWWQTKRKLWIFALGNLCFIFFCSLTHLSSLGVILPHPLIRHGYEFGMLVQSIFFAIGVSKKILDDRRSKDKLTMQALVAKAENKTKSAFLARMSHEIRTPLNGLVGMAELLKNTKIDAEQRQYLTVMESSGKNLESLLNDILDLSKMDAGKLQFDEQDVDLHQLFEQVTFPYFGVAENKGVKLFVECHPSVPQYVHLDPFRLQQIINNLLSNAIKFTARGKVSIHCRIMTGDQQNNLVFEVIDNGMGINEKETSKIFEAFEQQDKTIAGRFGGTGLGLSICRQLVRMMGGDISIVNNSGSGATVSFWLPLTQGVESLQRDGAASAALTTIYPGCRVLVAEDNVVNQQVIIGMLKRYKITADVVANGQQAVDKVLSTGPHYDLVLMDCEMPVMGGIAATKIISSLDLGKPLKIVALTAHVSEDYQRQCYEAGMVAFLAKPLHSERLAEVLAQQLSTSYNQQGNRVRALN